MTGRSIVAAPERDADKAIGTVVAWFGPVFFSKSIQVGLLVLVVGCAGELTPHTDSADGGPRVADGGVLAGAPVFRPTIQADLDSAGCIIAACHGGATLPMPLVQSPSSNDEWMRNYNEVKLRAGSAVSSLLMDKATGAGGHVASLTATDARMQRVVEWIAGGAPYEAGNTAGGMSDAGVDSDAGTSARITWNQNVGPLMVSRGCVQCHGAAQTSGGYAVNTFARAKGNGTDSIPNVVPGDPLSILVIYCEQGHRGANASEAQIVLEWVLSGALEN